MLQLIVPPGGEKESSELETDGDEEEGDEGEEEEGSSPVSSTGGQERETELSDGNTEHEDSEVEPASSLVKNTVIVLPPFPRHLNLQILSNIFSCSQ